MNESAQPELLNLRLGRRIGFTLCFTILDAASPGTTLIILDTMICDLKPCFLAQLTPLWLLISPSCLISRLALRHL